MLLMTRETSMLGKDMIGATTLVKEGLRTPRERAGKFCAKFCASAAGALWFPVHGDFNLGGRQEGDVVVKK